MRADSSDLLVQEEPVGRGLRTLLFPPPRPPRPPQAICEAAEEPLPPLAPPGSRPSAAAEKGAPPGAPPPENVIVVEVEVKKSAAWFTFSSLRPERGPREPGVEESPPEGGASESPPTPAFPPRSDCARGQPAAGGPAAEPHLPPFPLLRSSPPAGEGAATVKQTPPPGADAPPPAPGPPACAGPALALGSLWLVSWLSPPRPSSCSLRRRPWPCSQTVLSTFQRLRSLPKGEKLVSQMRRRPPTP